MLPQSHGRLGKGATADTFEQEFMMPPDITSIDSDINKISALTPFSDQFMPNVTTAGGSEHF